MWWYLGVIPTFWKLRQKADEFKAILIYLVKLSHKKERKELHQESHAPTLPPSIVSIPFCCFLGNWGWHPGPGIC